MHKFEATTATPETVSAAVDTKSLTDVAFHAMEIALVWDEAARENDLRKLEVEFGAMDVWTGQDQVPHTD
jgi:hypothetical protein